MRFDLMLPASPAQVAFPSVVTTRDVDRRLFTARQARSAFGFVLVVAGLALCGDAILGFPVPASFVILGGWLAALVASAVVTGIALVWSSAVDIGHIDDRHLAASLAWPVAGLALVLPLTLHALLIGRQLSEFNDWVTWSLLLVGHCHVALALMGAWRMVRLARGEDAMKPAAIYAVTVGLAMVPGAVFLLIPAFVVALTGLAFLLILWAPTWIIAHERAALSTSQTA